MLHYDCLLQCATEFELLFADVSLKAWDRLLRSLFQLKYLTYVMDIFKWTDIIKCQNTSQKIILLEILY